MPKIYAVLVGINNYPWIGPNLKGCINDITEMESWLTSSFPADNLQIKVLTDEKDGDYVPTKNNIIKAFDHFAAADNDDICLFYYGGHGANLKAPPEFPGDEAVQALVCHDFKTAPADEANPDAGYHTEGGLIDKELSYLVWKATLNKPALSFIMITDCCHSGTITRSANTVRGLRDTKYISPPIEKYYGIGDTETAGYEITTGPDGARTVRVKRGRHLHIAAAQDAQVAEEVAVQHGTINRGAFSFALLKTLQDNGGTISYRQINEIVPVKIHNYFAGETGPVQTPQLNLLGGLPGLFKDNIFLQNKNIGRERTYDVVYSKENGWCMQAGLLQNISKGDKIKIKLEADEDEWQDFEIGAVSPNFSALNDADVLYPNSKVFKAKIAGQLKKTFPVYFSKNVPVGTIQQIWDRQYKDEAGHDVVNYAGIELIKDAPYRYGIDYAINQEDNSLYLAGPTGKLYLSPAEALQPAYLDTLLEKLTKVGHWDKLLHFDNDDAVTTKPYELTIQCSAGYDAGKYIYAAGNAGSVPNRLAYFADAGTPVNPAFRLAVVNTGSDMLYIYFAYLGGANYSITPNVFDFLEIEPGAYGWLNNGNGYDIQLFNDTEDSQKPEIITDYLKVCITNKPGSIDFSSLYQEEVTARSADAPAGPLPEPGVYWKMEVIGFAIEPKV
jgi:hypothetical protein